MASLPSSERQIFEFQATQATQDAQVVPSFDSKKYADLNQMPDKKSKSARRAEEKHSSVLTEAFPTSRGSQLQHRKPSIQGTIVRTAETSGFKGGELSNSDNFSKGLTPSGLSINHEKLSENLQEIEEKTRLRRAEPLFPSETLGESYQYSQKQLERKAPDHLQEDFGVSLEGKTIEEMAAEYHDCIENLLQQQNLVVRKDGRLSKQEPTINIGDPETLGIVAFENNPLYDKKHFISSYKITKKAFDEYEVTGNIGLSPEERKAYLDKMQKERYKQEREQSNAPNEAKISNNQLREVERLKKQLKTNSNFQLTNKEKRLIERAEKYQEYKQQFSENNPNMFDDEF